jgi:CheY-like chemotaxis protein
LIAEDGDDLQIVLKQLLGANGYRFLEAVTGREAVEVAIIERSDLESEDGQRTCLCPYNFILL